VQAKPTSAPPLPKIPTTLNEENVGLGEEDANKDKNNEARSSTKGDGKGEFLIGIPLTHRSLILILIIEVTLLS
jgi:hypothetical protein